MLWEIKFSYSNGANNNFYLTTKFDSLLNFSPWIFFLQKNSKWFQYDSLKSFHAIWYINAVFFKLHTDILPNETMWPILYKNFHFWMAIMLKNAFKNLCAMLFVNHALTNNKKMYALPILPAWKLHIIS